MTCSLLLYRIYGQPKISKPKLLKGLNPVWKMECCKKPANIYALPDGSFVVYFGALFCNLMKFPNDRDADLPASTLVKKYPERFKGKNHFKSFIYPDAWCTVYERNEGYVRIEGLRERLAPTKRLFDNPYPPQVTAELFKEFSALSLYDRGFASICGTGDMLAADYERFIEDFVWKVFESMR